MTDYVISGLDFYIEMNLDLLIKSINYRRCIDKYLYCKHIHRVRVLVVWVQIPSRDTCVLIKHVTIASSFWMGRKVVGPMCCVTHVKKTSTLIENRRGSPRCSWLWLLYAPP